MRGTLFHPLMLFPLLTLPCYEASDQSILSLSKLLPKRDKNPDIIPKIVSNVISRNEPQPAKVIPPFNDPLWPKQWNLHNREHPTRDINVLPAWQAGLTGEGIRIALLDDGNPCFNINHSLLCRSVE